MSQIILAIETTCGRCSVAIVKIKDCNECNENYNFDNHNNRNGYNERNKYNNCDSFNGVDIVWCDHVFALNMQSTMLPRMINDAFAYSKLRYDDISYIALTVGPGSFTGIRIGVSFVQGMAMALNIPCVAVNTLDVIVYATVPLWDDIEVSNIIAIIPASSGQYYVKNVTLDDDRGGMIYKIKALRCHDAIVMSKNELYDMSDSVIYTCWDICDSMPHEVCNIPINAAHVAAIANICIKTIKDDILQHANDIKPLYIKSP